jgi:tetratricopeptide (TPR) repeat protein
MFFAMRSRIIIFAFLTMLVAFASRPAPAQDNLPELVKRIKPSSVAIATFNNKGEKLARGSGFFVGPDRIITNRHVIENAQRVEVSLHNGKQYIVKGVLAVDGEGDLALLQVDAPREFAIPLRIEKTAPQEGESIVVIGNPFGLEGSVSNGIVSAVREIPGYGKIIQITAPISPGSSGSPVVNMQGQVIGVATLQAAEGQSLNFAVPSDRIAQLKISPVQSFATLNSETKKSKRATAERLYSQGLGALSRDEWARAAGLFEKAVEIDSEYAEAWYQAGFCYGMLNRHQDALRASRQAARLRPGWTETYANIGASSFALGQFKDAADAYRAAVKLDPDNPDTQFALGLSFNKLNRTDEEILAYKRAVALKPDHVNAFEKMGQAYFKQNRFAEALNAFEQFKTYKPEAKSYNYVGECQLELGRFQESIDSFNGALGNNPDFGKARYNLGRAYLKTGDRELAEMQYQILRNMKSDWADRLYVLINP